MRTTCLSSLVSVSLLSLALTACTEKFQDQEKYQPPEWMEGKIFTQITKETDLSYFAQCLEKTGYDSILNTSGSYTVFAPSDEAFDQFLTEHPPYRAMLESDQPSEQLIALVECQILYNAWSRKQFQSLDVEGWIDTRDELSEPRGYKRQTLFREKNRSYPARRVGITYRIVDPGESNLMIKAYTQSNKFCPIFFMEFLGIHELDGSDYEFYFDRQFDSQKLYFAGAEFSETIPAENGFIYKTDRVVLPLLNGEEILQDGYQAHTYKKFLELVQEFSEFSINLEATYDQPGAEEGLDVDTLYNLRYPELVFNIHNELAGNTDDPKYTVRDHHGLMVPTDQALEFFANEYLWRWGGLDGIPRGTKKIIVNSHMARNAIYLKDLSQGFLNGEEDSVFIDEADIVQKAYGSNCSFLGLNKTIIPRVIKSVCRPMYLTRDYQIMMHAVEKTRVLSALKKSKADYAFYLPTDFKIGMLGDSSLTHVIDNPEIGTYHFESFNRNSESFQKVSTYDLRKRLLNQIAVSTPVASANKEFIRNLAGNYIVLEHDKGTVSGSRPTTFGFNGNEIIDLIPVPYEEETDNGIVYQVDAFFSFKSAGGYYGYLISEYPEFLDLLKKAGLYDPVYYDFPFLIDGEFYTVFIPSNQALNDYGVDTMSNEELRKLLKYHFVRGDLIFTDGKMPEGLYPTTRIDESSTSYRTRNSTLHIRPGPDVIKIMDRHEEVYLEIGESKGETNIMITYDPDRESDSEWDYITTGVIHNIGKVFIKDSLQVNQF